MGEGLLSGGCVYVLVRYICGCSSGGYFSDGKILYFEIYFKEILAYKNFLSLISSYSLYWLHAGVLQADLS